MKLADTVLDKHLFWEANLSDLDMEIHASYIIPRVMDYGNLEDVRFIISYYGKNLVRETLLKAPSLQRMTINFFANYYNLPLNSFEAQSRLEAAQWSR
ncbi:MAG: hypothetical protein PHY48_06540 [Candidatus Cloacimonetes bacterium]|nr:hypothetical protein [Candidatus Cloacimonadota bacterium]